MEIMDVLMWATGGTGFITGVASLLKTRSENKKIDADTFKTFFDESQERYENELKRANEEREAMKKDSEAYRSKTDLKIQALEDTIHSMDKRNMMKLRAINSAYRCGYPPKIDDCPVLKTLDIESEKDDKKSKN